MAMPEITPPVNDSVIGRGRYHARKAVNDMISDLASVEGEDRAEVFDCAAYRVGKHVAHGTIDRSKAGDLLQQAAVLNGLAAEIGPDAVQDAIAAGLTKGEEHGRLDKRAEADSAEAQAEHERLDVKAWPTLQSAAAYGLVGEIAALATKESEVDPIAVMGTALAFGAAFFGRNRFYNVGDTTHHSRHFVAIVGATSRARKGSSYEPVKKFFRAAEANLRGRSTLPFPSGSPLKISHGPLSSGEGLTDVLRDKRDDQDEGGVIDKRLFCIEGEFGAVLRAIERDGNTLSMALRVAWDGSTISPLTKHNKVTATEPHVCLVGHITTHELHERLSRSDIWNGLANRIMWLAARRQHMVPFPKELPDADVVRMGAELAMVIESAHSRSGAAARLVMSNSAMDLWATTYPELTQDHSGILGAVTSRAEAQALRLAITFALFDGADRIEQAHVEAGLAFWRYAFDSAGYIFGGAELDPIAQRILEGLRASTMTQDDIVNLFGRHHPKSRLESVLTDLQGRGRITLSRETTGGRPRKVWRLANAR